MKSAIEINQKIKEMIAEAEEALAVGIVVKEALKDRVGKKITKALAAKIQTRTQGTQGTQGTQVNLHAYVEDRKPYTDNRTLYVWGTDYARKQYYCLSADESGRFTPGGLDKINQQVADTTTRLENLQRLHENLPELLTLLERVERAEQDLRNFLEAYECIPAYFK